MSQMNSGRELTPEQRRAKIERDRKRRRDLKTEFQRRGNEVARLQAVEAELRFSLGKRTFENRTLTEENGRLKDRISILEDTVAQADALFKYDKFPSPNEDVANNETIITRGPGSSQSTIRYAGKRRVF